ncbi:MAG TPA: F0F1 ATP synthase subunit B [Armatimonadaceae bacterium]|jgi:F-type H+-transporting ATPase subunit b|nr:F0F1 ATP synthase subunit B [Armatimonadaceae bacterium]
MGILTDINFNLNAFLVNIFGFLLLLFVLNRFLFQPVGGLLDQRQKDIASTYEQLENDQKQMASLKGEYEQRLSAIEAEGRERINTMIKEAQSSRDQLLHEAQVRSKDMVTRAESEIEREREQALITIRQQVVDLALGAATKVIGNSLDEPRQRTLIEEFIATGGSGTEAGNGAASGPADAAAPAAKPARSRKIGSTPASEADA